MNVGNKKVELTPKEEAFLLNDRPWITTSSTIRIARILKNQLVKEKMDLDIDVARLRLLKANHQSQQHRLEDNLLTYFPEQIEQNKGFIAGFEKDMVTLSEHQPPEGEFAGMVVRGDALTDKDNAGAAILEACKEVKSIEPVEIGSYRGFFFFCDILARLGQVWYL